MAVRAEGTNEPLPNGRDATNLTDYDYLRYDRGIAPPQLEGRSPAWLAQEAARKDSPRAVRKGASHR